MKPLVRSLTTVAFILSLIAGSHTVVFAGVSGAESGSLAAGGQNSKRALASLCPSQLPHRIWLPLIIGGTDAAYANSIDTSGGWRLPLDGAAVISDGPGEDFHVNRSAEAVDYGINGQSFPVLAPADGVVLDVLHDNQSTFGWVVRVNHNNLYSFFAHVDGDSVPARIFVQAGQRVTQGQCIAMSSNSGVPTEGIHLHFEARMGAVAGNIFSGQSVPIREIPGHWWNPWYAPPPDFQHDAYLFSGGAQYPESRTPPSTMGSPSVRHLADVTAPPSALNSYVTNITGQSPAGTITLHLAASPNSPVATIVPADAYHTLFEVDKYVEIYGGWSGWYYVYDPTVDDDTLSGGSESYANGQHTYRIMGCTASYICVTQYHYIELFTNGVYGAPAITASYPGDADGTVSDDAVVLEFCASGAVEYQVYEFHGSTVDFTYRGPDCRIMVHRATGFSPVNEYQVEAHFADDSWSAFTEWLVVNH